MIEIDIKHHIQTSEGKSILDIKAKIPENQLVCISGKSGAGKTTLLRILAGLTKPMYGQIKFGDTIVFDSTEKINLSPQKRNIGFMFQDYALFPNLNVEENIFFAQSSNQEGKWAGKLIKIFDLEGLKKQKIEKLSGGQKQRVALARVLVQKAPILLLDEPLSAIDREMRIELQDEIIKSHHLLHSTTFVVSHDEDEINKMASCILYIKNGKAELVYIK